ncbi:DNA replication and repair protein RecF [Candidatus Saccharibacteria bacterium]|nr:DNA replication and repair protein RecF [Candidatus Saccharibacteria bacterium]
MKLQQLRVRNFRNHQDITCVFSPSVTTIHGMNGAGKTSLLEAIHIICRGSSFKGSDKDIIGSNHEWYHVESLDNTLYTRSYLYDARTSKKIKHYTVDDKKYGRLPQQHKWPVILFTPDDLRLVDGSPARRRRYLDYMLSQLDANYATALRRYERALLQRNKLLKVPTISDDAFFPWDMLLSQSGAYIVVAREQFLTAINTDINRYYEQIAGINDALTVKYSATNTTPSALLHTLQQTLARDRLYGATSVGPHRHDMVVTMKGRDAADVMSRGELRTFILAIKYIEKDMFKSHTQKTPIVLLDDVFGELDDQRQQHLLGAFKGSQVIITSTYLVTMPHIKSTHVKLGN